MFKKKTGVLLTVLSIVLIGIFSINAINSVTYAQGQKTIEEFFQPIGEFIQSNPDLLRDLNKTLETAEVSPDETVAWVNELPITIGELEFRRGLNQKANKRYQSYTEVFNVLVEEKIVFDYAIKNKLLPTEDEVKRFIAEEQNQYATNDEYKTLVDNLCKAANMSLEDYWNTYEWYNAFRLLTFSKSFANATKDIVFEAAKQHEEEKAKKELWLNMKTKLKYEAKVKINEKFKEFNFVLDKSKLYL
ncbi:hypothetical protein [Neomoorella humiferrea]|uniref:Uncharacterized protein n=1 Tax=Neomoorella humiferrea TaxID=676965 RepID=A0A2T0ANQ9_9FIRM|nr:hypothetical protein [Moorella humiferrea]PRR70660.1 hypothetical protein MOHU_17670 [Moorella humiferrea]